MNPRIKRKWVKALRERKVGKQQIKQGKKALNPKPNTYCCLGVLCLIHSQETETSWTEPSPIFSNKGEMNYLNQKDYLPIEVRVWADLEESDPYIAQVGNRLAELNDSGKTFKTIARLIEEEL